MCPVRAGLSLRVARPNLPDPAAGCWISIRGLDDAFGRLGERTPFTGCFLQVRSGMKLVLLSSRFLRALLRV